MLSLQDDGAFALSRRGGSSWCHEFFVCEFLFSFLERLSNKHNITQLKERKNVGALAMARTSSSNGDSTILLVGPTKGSRELCTIPTPQMITVSGSLLNNSCF